MGYGGKIPSGSLLFYLETFLKDCLIGEIKRMMPNLVHEMQRRCGKCLFIDHSHKCIKHVQYYNDARVFSGLFTGMNEYGIKFIILGEIRLLQFVQSTSLTEVKQMLTDYHQTGRIYGVECSHVWTDKCCDDRAHLEAYLPTIGVQKVNKTVLPLPPNYRVLSDYGSCSAVLEELLGYLDECDLSQVIIGLDTEWETKGNKKIGKIALIQIATYVPRKEVYLFHTPSWQKSKIVTLPKNLEKLLTHPKVRLAGNRIVSCDVKYLKEDWNVDIPANKCIRLNHLAKAKSSKVNDARVSLKTMCELVLGYTLEKDLSIRQCNWSAPISNNSKKIKYAVRDAWASLLIALQLHSSDYIDEVNLETDSNSPIESPEVVETCCISTTPTTPPRVVQVVHQDVFHSMKRITSEISKAHPLLYQFCLDLSRAFFQFNDDDVQLIENFLTTQTTTFEKKWVSDPDWILERVRRFIPSAEILESRLKQLKMHWIGPEFHHHKYGAILNENSLQELDSLINTHVRNGCISDPVDISLYETKKADKNGLPRYRCFRGTNAVELFHQYLDMRFSSWNAGLEFTMYSTMILVHRRNIRASERNRSNFPKIGHYNHNYLDIINDLHFNLYGVRQYLYWSDRKEFKVLRETFAIRPTDELEHQDIVTAEVVKNYKPSMRFLAIQTKQIVPFIGLTGKEEKLLYLKAVPRYIINGGLESIRMAQDWNQGTLDISRSVEEFLLTTLGIDTLKPTGTNEIWKKKSFHLDSYFKTYKRALERRLMTGNQIISYENHEEWISELHESTELPNVMNYSIMDINYVEDNTSLMIPPFSSRFQNDTPEKEYSAVSNAETTVTTLPKKSKLKKSCLVCLEILRERYKTLLSDDDIVEKSRICKKPYSRNAVCLNGTQ